MAQCPVRLCEICENSPGRRYCVDCEQCFCKTCEISHLKSKSCRNHVFQDADITNPEVKTPICKRHDEKFTYFCNTCTSLICNICLPTAHKAHDFCLINEAASNTRARLDKEVKAAEESIGRAKQNISTSQITFKNFQDEAKKTKSDIEDRVVILVNAVNNTKDAYLKSIDKHEIKESQKMKQEILEIEKSSDCSQEVLDKMKRSIAAENDIVLLDSSIDMTKTIKSVSSLSMKISIPERIQFDLVSTKPEPEKLIGNLNFVIKNTIDRDHCVKPSTTIKVGDRVRVKPSVKNPKHGWGNASHQSIGIVTSIQGQDLSLNFPANMCWEGTLTEMELV